MPEISILMPCYNTAATLPGTLASIAAQTFSDYEILAVDDGSSDATPQILTNAARQDSRLRFLQIEHGGIIAALNFGLAAVRGEFIARMDADDTMHPERLARQRAWFKHHPETDILGCRVEPLGQAREGFRIYLNWLNNLLTNEDIQRERFVESPLAHPSVMLRRAAFETLGGYEEHGWPEDYDLWLRAAEVGLRFAKTPEMLLAWRDHPARLTRADSRYALENFLRAKAHYLARGPLTERAVILWGAGMMGRRLSKHLLREGVALIAFVDVDKKKIGNVRRGLPILAPEDLPAWLGGENPPLVLAGVGARGARALIRARLHELGLVEGRGWWAAA